MSTAAPSTVNNAFASASLYVGDLAPDVTEALLFEIFNAVGPVASVRVCRDAATRRSLGYAYVNFHRVEDAERALDTMNFTNIRGKPCRIMWSHRDPSLRKSGFGNIFVKNLAKSIDNKALYDTFSIFGNILSCKVAMNSKRESLGYGFVHYESEDAALNAIARVNGMAIAGVKVSVAPFKSKKDRGTDKTRFTNIYVKNIPEDFTKERLDDLFSQYGAITSSMIATSPDEKSRGFGFVNFSNPEEAAAAVEALNNKEVTPGKRLWVGRAQKKEEREKELRDRFEQLKAERQKKYAGVNLYVKNLADNVDKERLIAEFSKYGQITSARVMADDSDPSKSRGFGFVCFATPEEATKAVTEMNGKMVEGKPLYVALAQRKEVRRAQLEQQHARAKLAGVPPPNMFPQGAPIYYPPPGVTQRVMFPPMGGIPRRWPNPQGAPGGPGPQQARNPMPQQMMNMYPMPMGGPMNRVPGGMGPRGGRGGRAHQAQGAGKQQGQPGRGPRQNPGMPNGQPNGPQLKFSQQVRNRDLQQGQQPVVPASVMPQQVPSPVQPQNKSILTLQELAAAPEEEQKQMIGERLFPLIVSHEPVLAGKITGMLLEMDNGELLHLLESQEALNEKIQEALHVLSETREGDKPEDQ
jgi:polyadenylate-binding protein